MATADPHEDNADDLQNAFVEEIKDILQESEIDFKEEIKIDDDCMHRLNELKDKNQRTLLHILLQRGKKDFAEVLLKYGASISAVDRCKQNALHFALASAATNLYDWHQDFASPLFEKLISAETINMKDASGEYPIQIAATMKTHPLPVPILQKLMSPRNMSCHTMVKLAVIAGRDQFLQLLEYALTFKRPRDLKFGDWQAFQFNNHDKVHYSALTQVIGINRMLLRNCATGGQVDADKIKQLARLLWDAGYSNIGEFTESTSENPMTKNKIFKNTVAPLLFRPRFLVECCRISVRDNIRDLSRESFQELNLPKTLTAYLSYNRFS